MPSVAWAALAAVCAFSIGACSTDAAYRNTVEVLESYKKAKPPPGVQESTEDPAARAQRYRAAAERGDSVAMFQLGVLYQSGLGVRRDYGEAVAWYAQAAREGQALAMTNLGYMHENGLGVTASNEQAIRWYQRAAEAGDAFAMDNLGNMHYAGRGFVRSYSEAAKWYRKAAERGFTVSMGRLAMMCHRGEGLERNGEHAYAWAALAMDRSTDKAQREKYLPLVVRLAQELDEPRFQRAKLLKDELASAIPSFSEPF